MKCSNVYNSFSCFVFILFTLGLQQACAFWRNTPLHFVYCLLVCMSQTSERARKCLQSVWPIFLCSFSVTSVLQALKSATAWHIAITTLCFVKKGKQKLLLRHFIQILLCSEPLVFWLWLAVCFSSKLLAVSLREIAAWPVLLVRELCGHVWLEAWCLSLLSWFCYWMTEIAH
jgi:hypothetical protein